MKNDNRLPLTVCHAGNLFNWRGNEGTAEMSDFGRLDLFKRIYKDACDVGFLCWSPRTNTSTTFYLADIERDRENDILWWLFKSECDKFTIKIWND